MKKAIITLTTTIVLVLFGLTACGELPEPPTSGQLLDDAANLAAGHYIGETESRAEPFPLASLLFDEMDVTWQEEKKTLRAELTAYIGDGQWKSKDRQTLIIQYQLNDSGEWEARGIHMGSPVIPVIPRNNETRWLTGYIELAGDTLHLDEVELITTEYADALLQTSLHNPERMQELGLQEEDMPNGYHIHNPDHEAVAYALTDDTVYVFTDTQLLFVDEEKEDRIVETKSREAFLAHLQASYSDSGDIPFFVEVEEGRVVRIEEKLLFTQ